MLSNGALNSYIDKLISEDGAFDRFGQVADNIYLSDLKKLLPASAEATTAFTYRRLARQLIGVDPITPEGEKLLDKPRPFFDLAAEYKTNFDLMVQLVPKSLSDAPSDCTFFTEDDCLAAREITSYFTRIKYLDTNGLGFPQGDIRTERLKEYQGRVFGLLLTAWKAFKDGKPPDPQPN